MLLILLLVWFLLSSLVGGLAGARGRNTFGYFLLSFVFSPLLGLIIVLVTRDLTAEAARDEERRREEEDRDLDRQREHEHQIESLRALTRAGSMSGPAGAPSMSVADELAKLAQLRDRNILTADEFEQQKRAILRRTTA